MNRGPYQELARPLLFCRDAETAHETALLLLARLGQGRLLPGLTRRLLQVDDPRLRLQVLGCTFMNPLGIAAGLDKNATAVLAWRHLGFGFAEIGTVTPRPQPGNPRPRLFRLPADSAIVNRFGFNSEGAEAVALRLRLAGKPGLPLGLNIGRNKDTANADAANDHASAMAALQGLGDWFVVNLSSPNTPELRALQAPDQVRALVAAAVAAAGGVPVLVKLAPDFEAGGLEATVDAALAGGAGGFVATNSTLQRPPSLRDRAGAAQAGGLSGAPLRALATEAVRRIYRRTRGCVPIVGVGGIDSAAAAYEKLRAGANLLQVYTGLVYAGPTLARTVLEGLGDLLSRDGLPDVSAAVGLDADLPADR